MDNYQKNSRPSEEVRCELEEIVGENWRKELYWNDSQKRKG